MNEEEFYRYINKYLGNINGGNVYVKARYFPNPQPQPVSHNPFTGRLNPEWWRCNRLEVGIVTPFGDTSPIGQGDTFEHCVADMRKNQPNLPLP